MESDDDDDYYNHFDVITNNGRVFTQDLSILPSPLPRKELTAVETAERQNWTKARRTILKHYNGNNEPAIATVKDLLKQRILAPCLVSSVAPSSRSKVAEYQATAGRRYPPWIAVWEKFAADVDRFVVPNNKKEVSVELSPFHFSGMTGLEIRDERQQEIFLTNILNLFLGNHQLTGKIVSSGEVLGKPDALVGKEYIAASSDSDEDDGNDGLRHEDSVGQNRIFIPDGDKERLVAIDLEDVTFVQ